MKKNTILGTMFIGILITTSVRTLNIAHSTYKTMVTKDGEDYFVTVIICQVDACAKLCYTVDSCVVGNYRVRGHICYLIHVIGEVNYGVSDSKVPGFVSWTKNMLDTMFMDEKDLCQVCNSTQRCEVDQTKVTCQIYACGRPPCPSSSIKNGNIYTVNAKLWYVPCGNTVNGGNTVRSLTCMKDGIWRSGYTVYSFGDGSSFALRIVDSEVNQATAIDKCKEDNANLTTVLTTQKFELFLELFANKSGDYWVDAKRVQASLWQTSYGEIQPMGYDIWYEYIPAGNDNCVRMRNYRQYKLDDYKCGGSFNYVCEVQL